MWANNPAAVAIAESLELTSQAGLTGRSVFLVSLGTGIATTVDAFSGLDAWIGSARDLMKSATSVTAGEVLARRSLPAHSYHRLQVVDERIAGAMDDPSPQRLAALKGASDALIRSRSAELDNIVRAIGA